MWWKKNKAITIAAAVLCCCMAVTVRTMAQETKPLAVEDALQTKQFAPLTPIAVSPDNKRLAYTVQDNRRATAFDRRTYSRTGVPPSGIGSDIWIQEIATGATRNLTEGQANNWLPSWSPDGHSLAFLSDRGPSGTAHLWVWDVERNELRKVTDASVRTKQIEWTKDSREVLVTTAADRPSRKENSGKLSMGLGEGSETDGDRNRATVTLYQGDRRSDSQEKPPTSDPWDLDENVRDLVSIDVRDGRVKTLVRGTRITTYSASPDGLEIAYTTPKRFEKPGSQQILYDLNLVGSAHPARTLASDIRMDFDARFHWSPDSSRISYREGGPHVSGDCFIVAIAGGAPENVTHFGASDVDSPDRRAVPLWDANGNSIFLVHQGELWEASLTQAGPRKVGDVHNRRIVGMISGPSGRLWTPRDGGSTVVVTHDDAGKQDGFYRIDLRTGESARLLENGQCYTCSWMNLDVTVSGDGDEAFYFREDAQHAPELWMVNRAFDSHRQLSHLNPQFENHKMGTARLIEWLSDNGKPLQGVLLLPAGYEEGTRYPVITWVYGGEFESNRFDHFGLVTPGPFNMQLFATRGYAVFLPDIPVDVGTPMSDIAKAVLPGVNKVIEMGIADPGRLGIMGHSFGGYTTLSVIVQTQRFKAAVEASGYGDTIGDYGAMAASGAAFGTAIEEFGQGSLGGTPWQERSRYIENSPVLYLDRVETPLLIVHGSEDELVASFLADEVFVDLRRLGKEVEYARYNGEDHSPFYWSFANRVDFCNRVIAWFDEHLQTAKQEGVVGERK